MRIKGIHPFGLSNRGMSQSKKGLASEWFITWKRTRSSFSSMDYSIHELSKSNTVDASPEKTRFVTQISEDSFKIFTWSVVNKAGELIPGSYRLLVITEPVNENPITVFPLLDVLSENPSNSLVAAEALSKEIFETLNWIP